MARGARLLAGYFRRTWLLWLVLAGSAAADESPLVFSMLPGNPVNSIAAPLIVEIYQRAGISVVPTAVPPLRETRMLEEGALDGIVGKFENFELAHPEVVRIPVPLETIQIAAFVTDQTPDLPSLLQRDNLRLGALRGIDYQLQLSGLRQWVFVNEPGQLMHMLVRGRVDAAISVDISGLRLARELPQAPIRMLEPELRELRVYHYLHRKHADLVPKITAVMQAMYDQGYLQALHAQFRRGTDAAVTSSPRPAE
ncbi:transporter substrate-binding domain-containing protein [Halopseudomonas sabulinigri]|uniref:Transporter substrate-binding domain-containing protein n=1 Tax=Halopseudomonas sabulinigri TaxID=472181 RepID=A0ABP9ZJY4_9GAMM